MTADDDSCSSYDSVSATDLTVGPTKTVTDSDIDTSKLQYQRRFLPTPTNREDCAVVSHIDLHYKVLCASNNCANKSMIGPILFLISIIFIVS